MKRVASVTLAVALVALMAGAAFAYGPRGMMGWQGGPGWQGDQGWQGGPGWHMGPGWMMGGPGRMGGGWGTCPAFSGAPGAPGAGQQGAITEDQAKELATAYADKYFKGYSIERVLPFEGFRGTMYQVELKGPKGEQRVLHVNPWGRVMPFGPVASTE
jgi:hypothetical protein